MADMSWLISVQKRPFSDSALLHLQLLSFEANFCSPTSYHSCRILHMHKREFCSSAITRAECLSLDKSSAVLLPQLQNVSHQRNILLSCYHKDIMFLTRQKFCCSVTTIAEYFSPEKHSAPLLPQLQNISLVRNTLQLW